MVTDQESDRGAASQPMIERRAFTIGFERGDPKSLTRAARWRLAKVEPSLFESAVKQ
jgi:hypothetical protein